MSGMGCAELMSHPVVGSLSSNSEIVIKPSDKSKDFVVMSESTYMEKVSKLLESESEYEKVNITSVALDETTRHFMRDNVAEKLPEKLEIAIKPQYCGMPRFYGLSKDHKPNLPLRPVLSTCGSSTSKMSLVLERILNQLLPFIPAHLSSTAECINLLKENRRVSENCIVA